MENKRKVVTIANIFKRREAIDSIAILKSESGLSGLWDLKTQKTIGDIDYYETKVYPKAQIIEQRKNDIINIYDVAKKRFIVEGWKLPETDKSYNEDILILCSPIDGKYHLFDRNNHLKLQSLFETPLDDVKQSYHCDGDYYYLLTANGKKGISHHNNVDSSSKGLIVPMEFNNIELTNICYGWNRLDEGMLIYTKGDKAYFAHVDCPTEMSEEFDKIETDKEVYIISYLKKGNITYVYENRERRVLFATDAEEIECIESSYRRDYINYYNRETCDFFFRTKKSGKYGLTKTRLYRNGKKTNKFYTYPPIENQFDKIYAEENKIFFEKEDGKRRLYEEETNTLLPPSYDAIKRLKLGLIALSKNGKFDIGKMIDNKFVPMIKNCILQKNDDPDFRYQKRKKQGLINFAGPEEILVEPLYKEITKIIEDYYYVQMNKKYGVLHLDHINNKGVIVIPIEFDKMRCDYYNQNSEKLDDRIHSGDSYNIILTFQQGEYYKLFKIDTSLEDKRIQQFICKEPINEIEYFSSILVLKNDEHAFVYNYDGKLLKKLPAYAVIFAQKYEMPNFQGGEYYIIDGIPYEFIKGHLTEMPEFLFELHSIKITIGDYTYQLNSYDKERLDLLCQKLEALRDDEAEKFLCNLLEKGVPKQYTGLSLKRGRTNV